MAPRSIVLHDRRGQPVMPLEPKRVYYGPGSDCLFVLDHRSGERRHATLQDVREAIRLCDALSHLDFLTSAFVPSDVPSDQANRRQMRVMIENSTKPIMLVTNDFESCRTSRL